jgi:hypothetical protein
MPARIVAGGVNRLVMLVALIAVACRHSQFHPTACDGRVATNGQLLTAVASIESHALYPELPRGQKHRRMKLERAVGILQCDGDRYGSASRRQRAVATLFAYGYEDHRFDDAIREFGVDPERLERTLKERYPTSVFSDPPALDQAVQNLTPGEVGVPAPSGPSAECEKSIKRELPDVVTDKGPMLLMKATISVTDPVSSVALSIDPRRWDNCGLFWDPPEDATKFAALDANGAPIPDPSDPSNRCLVQKDNLPGSPPGQPFDPRALFEDFFVSDSSTSVSAHFNNVLTVSVREGDDPVLGPIHRVKYDLAENGYLCGNIDGVRTVVSVDGGHLWAWTQNGRTWVELHKELDYGNQVGTGLASAVVAHHSLASELGSIVCCLKRPALIEGE